MYSRTVFVENSFEFFPRYYFVLKPTILVGCKKSKPLSRKKKKLGCYSQTVDDTVYFLFSFLKDYEI